MIHTTRSFLALALFLAAAASGLAAQAAAQSFGAQSRATDPAAVSARLERLEREIQTLNRQVFRALDRGGNLTGAAAPAIPPGSASSQGGSPASADFATSVEIRLQTLEETLRQVTGRVEELQFQMSQLGGRLDRALADIEFRLEEGRAAGTPSSSPGGELGASSATGAGTTGQQRIARRGAIDNIGSTAGQSMASGAPGAVTATEAPAETGTTGTTLDDQGRLVGTLGSLPVTDNSTGADAIPADTVPEQPAQTASIALPPGDDQAQYDYAFNLLRRYQFEEAEVALNLFLQQNAESTLAPEAQYWLGETYFVRGDYRNAAAAFAQSYEQFPENARAPNSLLKLGTSLGRLGQTDAACQAFEELVSAFPEAPSLILQDAVREGESLGCAG